MPKRDLGVPKGEAIRRELIDLFAGLRKRTLDAFFGDRDAKDDLAGIPDAAPSFELGALKESERFVPKLQAIWEDSGRALRARVGLDPDRWQVVNPRLDAAIRSAALDLAASTLASTTKRVNDALARTREELAAGALSGDNGAELRKRVEGVFELLGKSGARRIAQTEAARGHHLAQEIAAWESGIVVGWEMLLADDACPICKAIIDKAKFTRLGSDFAVIGDHPTYSRMRFPPFHPHCGCTVLEVVDPAISGEPEPKWSDGPYIPDAGGEPKPKPAPKPKPEPAPKPKPKPADPPPIVSPLPDEGGEAFPPKPEPSIEPILAETPKPAPKPEPKPAPKPKPEPSIADQIKKWKPGDAIVKKIVNQLESADGAKEAALKDQLFRIHKEFEEAKRSGASTTNIARRWKDTQDDYFAEIKRRRAILDDPNGPFAKILGIPEQERGRFGGPIEGAGGKAGKTTVEAARGWLGRFSRKLETATPVEVLDKPFRAEYDFKNIKGGPKTETQHYIHEYGHVIETENPKILKNSLAFLKHRVGDEEPKSLKKLFPNANYDGSETGRSDRFQAVFGFKSAFYVGKDYGSAGTEILSMGIEKLYADPYGFAKNDPEFFKYVVGTLHGVFR